jgi:hypothetical protein
MFTDTRSSRCFLFRTTGGLHPGRRLQETQLDSTSCLFLEVSHYPALPHVIDPPNSPGLTELT